TNRTIMGSPQLAHIGLRVNYRHMDEKSVVSHGDAFSCPAPAVRETDELAGWGFEERPIHEIVRRPGASDGHTVCARFSKLRIRLTNCSTSRRGTRKCSTNGFSVPTFAGSRRHSSKLPARNSRMLP